MKALFILFIVFCGCASSQLDWEDDDVMLPEGFPFILQYEFTESGPLRYWVLTYDLDSDDNPDLRVWYVYRSEKYDSLRNRIMRTVYPNPHKVEFFDGRTLAWKAKVDDSLEGKTQILLFDKNGRWQFKPHAQGLRTDAGVVRPARPAQ